MLKDNKYNFDLIQFINEINNQMSVKDYSNHKIAYQNWTYDFPKMVKICQTTLLNFKQFMKHPHC